MKQHSKVQYLGCLLDESRLGDETEPSVTSKTNSKIKSSIPKKRFLTPFLRLLLSNALIHLHFDYACSTWYQFKLLLRQGILTT